ncbi:MAG: gamma carbonic anhydrase family protein [Ferrovum sp.]|nr:gamma carbonic anhydrase family protein [Ferrovum sp.]
MIYQLGRHTPVLDSSCYVDENAVVIGAVTLGSESTLWCNAVLRADNAPITIGRRSNIQDGAVLHTDPGVPLTIGDNVSVGHLAMLHGCTVGDGSLIGIRAVILNHTVIGRNCLIGANTLLTENKVIPDGSLVIGSPGQVVRPLTPEEIADLQGNADSYVTRGKLFKTRLRRVNPSKSD